MLNSKKWLLLCLLFWLGHSSYAQFFYGTLQQFGKNRVQYNEQNWSVYRLDGFDVYYYGNDRNLPRKVALMVDRNITSLTRRLETDFNNRLQVIVFTTLSDLKQSNLISIEETPQNSGGMTRLAGSKLFVHFDGDYRKMEDQIRKAIAEVMLTYTMYGDLTESIRNSALLNLPGWFIDGLISYLSTPWTIELDEAVREGVSNKTYKRFNRLGPEESEVVGHALWHFIAETYGKNVIRNIFYMTLVERNVESAFQFVLGVEMGQLSRMFTEFYRGKYQEMLRGDKIDGAQFRKFRAGRESGELAVNSKGTHFAYVEHNLNEFRVFLYDKQKKRRRLIYKGGYKIDQNRDRSFPLLDWHPNGRILAFITEEKGFTWLYFYDVEKRKLEKKSFFGSDKINQFKYSPDGRQFVLSATRNGQTNIYLYTILSTSYQALTSDDYTDMWPSFIRGGSEIVFSSDRPETQLESGAREDDFNRAFDLFIYRLSAGPNQELRRVTNTPGISEIQATEWGSGYLHYLRRGDGVRNDFLVVMDSNIAYVDTITHYNYTFESYPVSELTRNIRRAAMDTKNGKMYYTVFMNKRHRIFEADRSDPGQFITRRPLPQNQQPKPDTADTPPDLDFFDQPLTEYEVDIYNYTFDESVLRELGLIQEKRPTRPNDQKPVFRTIAIEEPMTASEFNLPPKRNYFLSFFQDELTFQLDNTFLNPQYQPFTGRPDANMLNPGFNGVFRLGMADLMEDYMVTLAFRTNFTPLPGSSLSPNHEIFLRFANKRSRLNQETFFFRRSQVELLSSETFNRFFSHEVKQQYTYPFSPVSAIQFAGALRMDHRLVLSRELNSLREPTTYEFFGSLRAAYIFDNVRLMGVNLMQGTRYKVFTEYYRRLETSPSGLHTLGIDFRNYSQVHGPVIWANRVAIGTSFGREKLIHFLGGVDNQFIPQIDESVPIADENYIFQTLATNMRGFFQNARNGNSFAVINSELRIPLFRYLLKRPILNDFVNSFQIMPFFDVGTAWNGLTPYVEENAINNQVIDRGNIRVVINSNKEPIIAGMGVGLRAQLFGYFVRVDYARGIEDGLILPRVWHFSIGTDF